MKKFMVLFSLGLFFLPQAKAAIVNISGAETGDTSEFSSLVGTVGSTTSVVHSGTYSLRCNASGAGTGAARLSAYNTAGAVASNIVFCSTAATIFYFQYLTKAASNDEEFFNWMDTGGLLKMSFRLNSAGNIVAYDHGQNAVSTGTTVLNSGTWYKIASLAGTGTSAYYELKINDALEVSGFADLTSSSTCQIRVGKGGNRNGQSIDYYFDDIVWSSVTYPTDGRVAIMVPNANGGGQTFSIGAGSGAHWQIVDDVPPDGDTSYLVSPTDIVSTETFRFQTSASAGISGTINFVKFGAITKQDGASGGLLSNRVVSGTTTFTPAGTYATTAAYALRMNTFATDPNSGVAGWTSAALDTIVSGLKCGSATNASRVTAVYTMVHYTPVTSGQRSYFYIQ